MGAAPQYLRGYCRNSYLFTVLQESSKMKRTASMIILFFCGLLLLPACSSETPPPPPQTMLIFCGITMIKPMMDIAEIIESGENIKIVITKGGSGNLLKSIVFNGKGDLYLPGSERYYQTIDKKSSRTDSG